MVLAVQWLLAAAGIEGRVSHAQVVRTTAAANVYHAGYSMLPAVHCRLTAADIEARYLFARVV